MTVDLTGLRIKLQRAEHHARALNNAIRPALEAAEASIYREDEKGTSRFCYRIGKVPSVDPQWQGIIGDCLFNLRSAWDHLAWQLVELDGQTPTRFTQFPIYEHETDANGRSRAVDIHPGIRRIDVLDALRQFQPFRDPNPWNDQLFVVNELCNRDKHRLLLTVVTSIDADTRAPWWSLPPEGVSPAHWFNLQPLMEGDLVARFDFKGAKPPEHFDFHLSLAVVLNETPIGHWARMTPVDELLIGLRQILTHQMDWKFIEPFFPSEAPLWTSFPPSV